MHIITITCQLQLNLTIFINIITKNTIILINPIQTTTKNVPISIIIIKKPSYLLEQLIIIIIIIIKSLIRILLNRTLLIYY